MDPQPGPPSATTPRSCNIPACHQAADAGGDEAALALLTLDDGHGNLRHTAHHIGRALRADPLCVPAHEALARLAAEVGGAEATLALFPTARPATPLGVLAARTCLAAQADRWSLLLTHLTRLIAAAPGRPWVQMPGLDLPALPAVVDEQAALKAANQIRRVLPHRLSAEVVAAMAPVYAVIGGLVERYGENSALLAESSSAARRLGDHDTAVTWATRAHTLDPGFLESTMLGMALREAGRTDEALAAWAGYAEAHPEEAMLRVDIAELYASTGRPQLGLPWLEQVLTTDPDHEKAAPSAHRLRFLIDQDNAHILALADHRARHPDHAYAGELLALCCQNVDWLGRVGYSFEGAIEMFRSRPRNPAEKVVSVRSTRPVVEPPSALLALRLAEPATTIFSLNAGVPDPREPSAPVTTRVWTYQGLAAVPAVRPPAPEATERVRAVAISAWPSLPDALALAAPLAELSLADLLGVLVHPPAPRDDDLGRIFIEQAPDFWVRAVQTFACLAIAQHQADQPWAGSDRRRVLVDLLNGPEDWVCEAAGAALAAVGWTQPETRPDVGRRIAERLVAFAEAHKHRQVTNLASVCHLLLACPWVEPEALGLARTLLAHLASAGEATDSPAGQRAAVKEARQLLADAGIAPGTAATVVINGQEVITTAPKRRLFGRR